MDASLNPPPRSKPNWRELIQNMSEISTSAYRKYLNQNEDFIRYFKTVTPHKSLGKLAIGSRPTKRKNVDNIQSLRAIPWVFAWTQIRLMLPAWLGTTEALRYGSIKKFKRTMTDMERNWPYFVSTMDILDMVISKVDPKISVIYENNLADASLKRIGKKLRFQTFIQYFSLLQKYLQSMSLKHLQGIFFLNFYIFYLLVCSLHLPAVYLASLYNYFL